ncbi:MAG: M24 family metallopeptidase [Planctomycetota bacterium]
MDYAGITSRSIRERVQEFRGHMSEADLEAYWVVKEANVRYLSGFKGDSSTLFITHDVAVLITDSRFEEQAEEEAAVDRVTVRQGSMMDAVEDLCQSFDHPRTGLTASNVTYADGRALMSSFPGERLEPLENGLAERMRLRKGQEEVDAIVRAIRLAEDAFRAFESQVQPGRSEKWLGAWLEWEMKRRGAEGEAFDTICAVAERGSLPHAGRTQRELQHDMPLLVDWGARLGGYHSDLTRVLTTGTMPRRVYELIRVVLRAQQAALDMAGPGVSCSEVDRAARDVIDDAGYGGRFAHSLGHGVGLEVHEAPRLAQGNDRELAAGMVLTVEPGIYIPGEAGVRVEDMIVITSTGHEMLSSLNTYPAFLTKQR